jgi:hypothetical protein
MVALLAVAGCSGKGSGGPASPEKVSLATRLTEATFVGDSTCTDCHPDISKKQAATGHAATLRPMQRDKLGRLAPPSGRIPGSEIVLVDLPDGRYGLKIAGEKGEPTDLDFAIGSGKTGMTHVAVMSDNSLLELGRSYFPSARKWYVTPGHEKRGAAQIGMVYDPKQARECFACHAVTVPARGVVPNPIFYGVGCEACHGPASVHVDAATRAEAVTGTLEKLAAWKPSRLNALCGKCHRTQQSIQMSTGQSTMTNRFQAYGLMKSRCYKESGGQISCSTCHDPHTNTSRDVKTYEAACLKCHAGPVAAAAGSGGKACPVNPKSGCVPCHMPSRPVFKNSVVPTRMADHLIAIHKSPYVKGRPSDLAVQGLPLSERTR